MRFFTVLFFIFIAGNTLAEERPAEDLGQSFLKAMGGSEVWSKAHYIRNWAVNWNPAVRPGPYSHEYWLGLDQKQQFIELKSQWVDLTLAFDETQGWRLENGILTPFDGETLLSWHHDWEASLYRKIYLLAVGDKDLVLTTEDGHTVHFSRYGEYLGWIDIDVDGAPVRLGGSRDGARFVTFEPLVKFGIIAWPAGGAGQDGWRFEILKVELLNEAPVVFLPPENE